jgi:transcriptional regulator with XRE-family HTH domain
MQVDSEKTLGKAIAHLRREGGLSVEQLAARAGLRPGRLAAYEAGVTEPRWQTLERLLLALEVGPAALGRAIEAVTGQPLDDTEELAALIRFHQEAAELLVRVVERWPGYARSRRASKATRDGETEQ